MPVPFFLACLPTNFIAGFVVQIIRDMVYSENNVFSQQKKRFSLHLLEQKSIVCVQPLTPSFALIPFCSIVRHRLRAVGISKMA